MVEAAFRGIALGGFSAGRQAVAERQQKERLGQAGLAIDLGRLREAQKQTVLQERELEQKKAKAKTEQLKAFRTNASTMLNGGLEALTTLAGTASDDPVSDVLTSQVEFIADALTRLGEAAPETGAGRQAVQLRAKLAKTREKQPTRAALLEQEATKAERIAESKRESIAKAEERAEAIQRGQERAKPLDIPIGKITDDLGNLTTEVTNSLNRSAASLFDSTFDPVTNEIRVLNPQDRPKLAALRARTSEILRRGGAKSVDEAIVQAAREQGISIPEFGLEPPATPPSSETTLRAVPGSRGRAVAGGVAPPRQPATPPTQSQQGSQPQISRDPIPISTIKSRDQLVVGQTYKLENGRIAVAVPDENGEVVLMGMGVLGAR